MSEKLLKGQRIFVAEDNPTNQLVVGRMIEQLGGSHFMASDGVEAIQNFDPDRFDLALLDIEMPKKSGIEVAKYIRSRPDVAENFPIVALTAFVLDNHRRKILSAGVDGIIAKPIMDIQKFGAELLGYLKSSENEPSSEFDGARLGELRANLGEEMMPEILEGMRGDLGAIFAELSEPLSATDLRKLAHKLFPLAEMAGGRALATFCRALEDTHNNIDHNVLEQQDEMRDLLEALIAYLGEQK